MDGAPDLREVDEAETDETEVERETERLLETDERGGRGEPLRTDVDERRPTRR
ncbi:hypothetical protein [Halococcus sp. IIIV-5B]|uniref:hypothetical protein n=1 Tax=Halococcus sp. IIIV-5B TaxID=2321230 RepID=UPI001314FE39|nr:hypothetical protein [Halococcus sp. IIIV-5B]